jgi:dTDP-4-dehydrorhamnose reductase
MKKVLIIGANGQLGTDLCGVLTGFEIVPCTHEDIEIADANSVQSVFAKHKPDTVINTAAYVRVDDCEDNVERAFLINALGARNVAVACQDIGASLIHLSTDYVFGAEAAERVTPYTEFDTPLPRNIYGKSKLAGEELVRHLCSRYFIIRTSGLFGTTGSLGKGGNFVQTIIKLASQKQELEVVNDQVFSPTYSRDLALKIGQIIETKYYGIFHVTNAGFCSWYEFAQEILRHTGLKNTLVPVSSAAFPQKAQRPHYSVLNNFHLQLLGLDDMRHWKVALSDYLKLPGSYNKISRPRRKNKEAK